jgi:hypothetical protein
MAKNAFLLLLIVCLFAGCGGRSSKFDGPWKGGVGAGKVDLLISGRTFKLESVAPPGRKRTATGTAKEEGERSIVLTPDQIDGRPAKGSEKDPMALTMSTDGKHLQAGGLVLERQ